MAVFSTVSIDQDPRPYVRSVQKLPPQLSDYSTVGQTDGTYTCDPADYGKLFEVTCYGGSFLVAGGSSISGYEGRVLAPGAVLQVVFDETYPDISYKEATGATFSSSIFLTICRVSV